MNQQQNEISLARVNNSGFPGWKISSFEPSQTPTLSAHSTANNPEFKKL